VDLSSDDIERFSAWSRAFTTLETPRLVARRLTADDADAIYEALKNPRVNRWLAPLEQPFDRTAARRWLVSRLKRMEDGEGVQCGIEYRGSPVLLGFVGLALSEEAGGIAIGGAVSELYWGKGFVEEMCFVLVNEMFRIGVSSLVGTCAVDNWSSMRVLHTLNFEQVDRKQIATPQGDRDSFVYRLTPERWRSARVMPLSDGLSPEELVERRKALYAIVRDLKSARDYMPNS